MGLGERQRRLYPWLGAVLGGLIIMSTIWSLFYPFLMKQFEMTDKAPFALGASILGLGNMLLGPIVAGYLVDRFGPRASYGTAVVALIIATFCMRALGAATEWSSGATYWYLGSLFYGFAVGMYTGTAPALSMKWNPDKMGFATGVANIGPALAPVWLSPIAAALIPRVGIGNAFTILFISSIVVILVLGVAIQRQPEKGWKPEGWEPPAKVTGKAAGLTLKEAAKTKEYWFLFLASFFCLVGGFLFMLNIATIMIEGVGIRGGMDPAKVVPAVIVPFLSISAFLGAVMRPAWGWFLDKMGSPWRALKVTYTGLIITLLIFTFLWKSVVSAIIGACLIYFFFQGSSPIHMAGGPFLFGTKEAGKITGTILVATGLAWIVGPYLGAWLADISGTYATALYVGAASVFIALILVFLVSTSKARATVSEAAPEALS